jgi:hypothetical protein
MTSSTTNTTTTKTSIMIPMQDRAALATAMKRVMDAMANKHSSYTSGGGR